jgi:hypothetical protein
VTERAAKSAARLLERGTSRRGFLSRAALVASAFAVAPIRYLLRPVSAWAVIRPGNCPPGSRCQDGYTEFCCSINEGRNSCPPYSYVGGWWKCTNYAGRRLCSGENVRYYMDCNLKPGHSAPGGCHCAGGTCGERRVACNVFRYGQCNTQTGGVTAIVCRVVTCVNPATVPEYKCNATYMTDNSTCGHEAGCLSESHAEILGPSPGA